MVALYITHVPVTAKFTNIANILLLNAVAYLQFAFCKCSQHLFKYPTNKSHHNYPQIHITSIST